MDAGNDAELQYVPAAITDESAGMGEAAARLAALCDVLAMSGPDFILAIPHASISARLPALLAGSGSDGGDVPLLAACAIAEACEAVASAVATRCHLESPLRAPPNRRRRLESPAIARMSLYAIPSVDEINEQSDKPELTSREDLGVQVASMLLEEVAHGGVVDSTHQRAPTAPALPLSGRQLCHTSHWSARHV